MLLLKMGPEVPSRAWRALPALCRNEKEDGHKPFEFLIYQISPPILYFLANFRKFWKNLNLDKTISLGLYALLLLALAKGWWPLDTKWPFGCLPIGHCWDRPLYRFFPQGWWWHQSRHCHPILFIIWSLWHLNLFSGITGGWDRLLVWCHQYMLIYTKILNANICQYMSIYAKICQYMPICALIC